MNIGLLYPFDDKKLEQEQKAGKEVTVGIDPDFLLNMINASEINNKYALAEVLIEIKSMAMELLGKVEINKDERKKTK